MIVETAPAKVNLYLHVGPVRNDGLHELASLFVFADCGDKIKVAPSSDLSLRVEGPFSAALEGFPIQQNLVWRAASLLQEAAGVKTGAAIVLKKKSSGCCRHRRRVCRCSCSATWANEVVGTGYS